MADDTESPGAADRPAEEQVLTSGHVERTILHHVAGDGDGHCAPTTVSGVLDDVASVIDRGGYADMGPNGAAGTTVRKSTVRRAFNQLHDKGLVRRVADLAPTDLRDGRFDLGELASDGDPDDPTAYARTTDDARVTDWVLSDEGRRETERLDARYADELDDLAARYGRPRGETTARIEA